MEAYFNTIFEDVGHERSLILLLSLVEPSILKQSKFTDHEIEIIKNLALEKLYIENFKGAYCNGFVRKTNRRYYIITHTQILIIIILV